MRKLFYTLLCASLFSFGVNAQTLEMKANSWTEENDVFENSQGTLKLEPSMKILKGYKVVVHFIATTTGGDETISATVIDTTSRYDEFGEFIEGSNWNVVSNWESFSVSDGSAEKTISFTAGSDLGDIILSFSTPAGTTYNESFTFSTLECTVSDPNYRDPNVTTDETTITLDGISFDWGESSYDVATKTITFNTAWTGEGWAWWGTGLDVTDYQSVTVEFEATDCQVKLWAQQLTDGTIDENSLMQGQAFADAGATSVTLDFEEMYKPFVKERIGQLMLMRETAGELVLKSVYLTYASDETGTAVSEVSKIQIENGVVYSEGPIVVYNANGQTIATANCEYNINVLPSGVYFVKTVEGFVKYFKK